jgi:chaperonin GroES
MAKKIQKKAIKKPQKAVKAKKPASKKIISKPVSVSQKARIQPLGDRVLIRPFTEEEVKGNSHFGIILPESVSNEKSAEGIVLAVGEGKLVDGKLKPIAVSVGDRVLFSKYGYDEVKDNGEDLYILREDGIFAILNK